MINWHNIRRREIELKALQRILHAEDDFDIQFLLRLTFDAFPQFDYQCCNNGQELLDQLETFQPDLIVLDMMMPKLNGLQTLEKLKNNPETQSIPVIFLTAKIQPEEVNHYEAMGAFAILFKPLEITTLPTQLEELWQKHQALTGG